MIELIQANPLMSLAAVIAVVLGGTYVPWDKLKSLVPSIAPKQGRDAVHDAICTILDYVESLDDEEQKKYGAVIEQLYPLGY